jgi:hypothetical protein
MKDEEQAKVEHKTVRSKRLRYGYKLDAKFHLEVNSSKPHSPYSI